MAAEGVSVINHSVSWKLDGPGDGTSPFSDSPLKTVDRAVDEGITWINATSNGARKTWFGPPNDSDGDDFLNFDESDEGNTVYLDAGEVITAQLRWDDSWDEADSDFDLYLYYVGGGSSPFAVARSLDFQTGRPGQTPYESIRYEVHTSGEYALAVVYYMGDPPEWLQLTASGDFDSLEHYVGHHSTFNPEESANPGMLAVGAAPWYNVNVIEPFSGQGPTTDGRVKPDIVGVDCGETALLPLNDERCGFSGTSQAAAHVAGLASLVRQRFPDYTPQQVAGYLKDRAVPPETAAPNNTWGYGLAQLPSPETATPPPATDSCVQYLDTLASGDTVTRSSSWTNLCDSVNRTGSYARFYTFTLEQETEVKIDLTSDEDAYLFLLEGMGAEGAMLYSNDDASTVRPAHPSHDGNTDSHITATLEPGGYTVEATTYSVGQTGEFDLSVRVPFASAVTPSTDGCLETLGGLADPVNRSGKWTVDCDSTNRSGSYARFYAFALEQSTEVQVDLDSSQDTYLYLLEGASADGMALAENDDAASGDTNSRITITLYAGLYTVEVTTYAEEVTGGFTLSVVPKGTPSVCARSLGILRDPVLLDGSWTGDCASPNREVSYAYFYSFELDQETEIRIDLTSDQDTYLYLLEGSGADGLALLENDDVEDGNTNSLVSITLGDGVYTVEATTYTPGVIEDFTLRITGLKGSPGGCFQDMGVLTDEINQTGTWNGDCASTNREGSYARFYSFALSQETEVHVDLSSTLDTYLYLLEGAGPWRTVLAENDDVEIGNSDSRVVVTLDAGYYTVEATTYTAGETGDFTLAIASPGLPSEREALVALYDATDGDNWENNENWLSDAPVAQWHGVTAAISGRVTGLDLSENRLTGDIPSELASLSSLERLYLHDNNLSGEIPSWVGALSNLQWLDLGENRLSGEIPTELGDLTDLQELLLDNNQLAGEIPFDVGDLTELRQLHLNDNNLTGEITFTLASLDKLLQLDLGFNDLTGEIPAWIGDFSNLIRLDLGHNRLTGEIPPELGRLASLQVLWLDENQLEGTIPPELGDFPELTYLRLDHNQLTGEIPDSLSGLAKLQGLYLSDNQLSGTIPAWVGSFPRLLSLDLRGNQLTGEIPTELGQLSTLQVLHLEGNQLTGEIPPELGQITEVLLVHLDQNQLTGEIPSSMDSLTNLTVLNLSDNQLSGGVPTWIGDFSRMTRLDLSKNRLDGEIPTELGGLPKLRELRLNSNLLEGAIPDELADLSMLEVLYLSDNQLTGVIPPALLALSSLESMSFWGNELQGAIPSQAADRSTLSGFYNATGCANWTNSANWLSDEPTFRWYGVSVATDGRVTGLSLGQNGLSGAIPPALGNLDRLITLDLSDNQLVGGIPVELGGLTNLTDLLLAGNQLTGCMPASLEDVEENDFDALGLPFCDG